MWIISIHSSEVDLLTPIRILFNQKNKTITASNIDALYYSMITEIIHKYELLLTSIELSITDFEQQVNLCKILKENAKFPRLGHKTVNNHKETCMVY